eukprot:2801254-Rhodomonas_salina.1
MEYMPHGNALPALPGQTVPTASAWGVSVSARPVLLSDRSNEYCSHIDQSNTHRSFPDRSNAHQSFPDRIPHIDHTYSPSHHRVSHCCNALHRLAV